jgi:hypothetical protein
MNDKARNLPALLVVSVATLLLGPLLTIELLLRIDASNSTLLASGTISLFISWVICRLVWRRKSAGASVESRSQG